MRPLRGPLGSVRCRPVVPPPRPSDRLEPVWRPEGRPDSILTNSAPLSGLVTPCGMIGLTTSMIGGGWRVGLIAFFASDCTWGFTDPNDVDGLQPCFFGAPSSIYPLGNSWFELPS